ncbi:MAG: hypothetical protein MPW14_13235 [Candidatus Manganitrophus sp.]|nr:MAG: hypothetical protein MPW14_13235 [Candidatus Manganitrophus sp.]
MEDLIAPEEMVITVSHTGYIKRTPSSVSTYRRQRRGGQGKIGAGLPKKRTGSSTSSSRPRTTT